MNATAPNCIGARENEWMHRDLAPELRYSPVEATEFLRKCA
jgi:hypothetical protein